MIFTKHGIKIMPLKDTPVSYSYAISNNRTKARTCEVGAALGPRTSFSGYVFENVNNKLCAVRIFSSFFSFISIMQFEEGYKLKYNMSYKVLFLN